MPIHVSAELSHVCPLEDITAHAAALESGGFYRVWVPDTVVSPWEAWLAASLIMQDDLAYTDRPGSDQSLYASSSSDGPDGGNRATGQWGTPDPVHWQRNGRFLEKAGSCSTPPQSRSVSSQYVAYWLGADECDGTAFQIDAMLLRASSGNACIPSSWQPLAQPGGRQRCALPTALRQSGAIRSSRRGSELWPSVPSQRPFLCLSRKRVPISSRASLTTLAALKDRVAVLEAAGFDEVIVAYADRADLEAAARLLE